MEDMSWESFINFPDDEQLTNSYSLIIENCDFKDYDNEIIEQNDTLLNNPSSSILNNNLNELLFFNEINETIDPNVTLFHNSNDDTFSEYSSDELDELTSAYQYNLKKGDIFDDWQSVDTFMHQYCLERGFGYQNSRSDKDKDDSTIIRRKSFRCSSSGKYIARKNINQDMHRSHNTIIKTNCEWHCNFTFPKTTCQIKCTTLEGEHNHELLSPSNLPHIIVRY